jgi:hypothetical protein
MRITSYSARYQLEKPEHNCPTSFPAEPTIRLQYSGASWLQGQWKTDVESDLKNINRLGTRVKNNQVQYNLLALLMENYIQQPFKNMYYYIYISIFQLKL